MWLTTREKGIRRAGRNPRNAGPNPATKLENFLTGVSLLSDITNSPTRRMFSSVVSDVGKYLSFVSIPPSLSLLTVLSSRQKSPQTDFNWQRKSATDCEQFHNSSLLLN